MLWAFIKGLIKKNTGRNDQTDEIKNLKCNIFTRKGIGKETNEDSFLVDNIDVYSDDLQNVDLSTNAMHVFAVFDGVSTGGNGKKSSEMAAQYLKSILKNSNDGFNDSFLSSIDTSIKELKHNIYEAFSNQEQAKWGTTMAMLIIYRNQCVVYNAGDSRVYRFTDSSLIQLSHDHTIENYKRQLGFLKKDPYISEKDGSILYQYLGKDDSLEYYKYGPFTFESNDCFLICSDGISGSLKRKDLMTLFKSDQNQTVLSFADVALKSGATDDQTGILITVE